MEIDIMDTLSSSTYVGLEKTENNVSTLANPNEEHDFRIYHFFEIYGSVL